MFFLRGDLFWRFNLPGRPLFNWVWGATANCWLDCEHHCAGGVSHMIGSALPLPCLFARPW